MRTRTIVCVVGLILSLGLGSSAREQPAQAGWPQWGGPNRNFVVDSRGLASSWPASGPKKVWSRALGEGHSAIAVDGGRLYTMYRPLGMLSAVRRSQEEVIAALDANTGNAIWELRFASPTSGVDFSEGAGPHSTPLVTGDRMFAAGSLKGLFALNKADGKVVWSHDLIKEYGADGPGRGDPGRLVLLDDKLIVSVGGKGQALAAFNPRTGALIWKAGDFEFSPSSPIAADVDGQKQVIFFAGDVVAGLDPATGHTLWTRPHKTDWGLNISTPLWFPGDHLLFVSSAYGTGSRVLELHQAGGTTTVAEKWFTNPMPI